MSLFGDFLVRIFLNLDWTGRFTKDISVCSPNAENYARKNPNTVTFHAMYLSMNVVLVLLRLPSGKLGSALFSYKHTGELGWSSTCLRFSQWAWNYAWWYAFDMNTAMVSFKYSILNIQLSSTWILQWSL